MKKLVLVTMVFGLIAVSCKKKAKDDNASKIVGKWKWESYLNDIDDSLTTISYPVYITFNANGTMLQEYAGVPASGTWSLVGNTQLIMVGDSLGIRDTTTIKKLVPPDMTFEGTDYNGGTPYTYWEYFKKQ